MFKVTYYLGKKKVLDVYYPTLEGCLDDYCRRLFGFDIPIKNGLISVLSLFKRSRNGTYVKYHNCYNGLTVRIKEV